MKARDKRWFVLLLFVARWLGVSAPDKLKCVHLLWSLLMLTGVWFFVLRLLLMVEFSSTYLPIQRLFFLSELPTNFILTAFFILRGFRSRNVFKELELQLLETVDAGARIYEELGKGAFIVLFALSCFHVYAEFIDMAWAKFDPVECIVSFGGNQLPNILINFSLVQYVLAHQLICLLYQHLGQRVRKLGLSVKALGAVPVDLQLEQLRQISLGLDARLAQLQSPFGFFLAFGILDSLLLFSYEVFNAFRMLDFAVLEDWVLYSYRALWLIMHGSRVWFVLKANERITEQKCKLSLGLNKLEVGDTRMERAINRFLWQLQSKHAEPLAFCLELDTMALGGIINALLAIVIFLISIDLSIQSVRGYI